MNTTPDPLLPATVPEPLAPPAPSPEPGPEPSHHHRRNGFVARLPKNIRDKIDVMMLDGVPYRKIIEARQLQIAPDSSRQYHPNTGVIWTNLELSGAIWSKNEFLHSWFLRYQLAWLEDLATLRLCEKSRQIGATKTDALDSILKASPAKARLDVWVTPGAHFLVVPRPQTLRLQPAMAFKDFLGQEQGIQLLQRSLEQGRLAHGYLFTGHQLDELETLARTLAKTLNCQQPIRSRNGAATDSCDHCLSCQKIEHANHADVHWVRPESKSRVITIGQMRDLMQEINLKPTEAEYKVAVIVAADRLNEQAANAFLKTLEEPPAKSILILLTTDPQRLLETILSRCLRLNFAGEGPRPLDPAQLQWLTTFSEMAAANQKSLLGRYRLMDVLLRKLNEARQAIEEMLTARSPLERYEDAEKELRDRWEDELTAAVEAEYRRQRADLLALLQWWLRDVWLQTLDKAHSPQSPAALGQPGQGRGASAGGGDLLTFPQLKGTAGVAGRITSNEAMENLQVMEQLQRWLNTNVQEALALEVGLLKLHL